MGMTIDESLEWLISRKEHYEMDDSCQELAQALDIAIDIMRKYQKIQEIMAKRPKDMISSNPTLRAISEVLKDGNDTTNTGNN